MKITLVGSLGNITKPLTQKLVKEGHDVTVITSKQEKAQEIESLGAEAAVGSIADEDFLTAVFTGADAVYTMVPPDYSVIRFREYVKNTATNYANAIIRSGVKRVVHLSSIGADIPDGVGLITAIRSGEQILNKLDNVSITYLRAGLFFTNYKVGVVTVKDGFLGNVYGDVRLLLAAAVDVATAAAEELQIESTGKNHRYVVSQETTSGEVAKILGAAIDFPELKWVQLTPDQLRAGLEKRNMPRELINDIIEMGIAVNNGIVWGDFDSTGAAVTGKTKLKDFGPEFAETVQAIPA